MSIESWIIEETEKEERQRREDGKDTRVVLPRNSRAQEQPPVEAPKPVGGRVEVIDISPTDDNVIPL